MDLRFSQFEILTGAGTLIVCLFFICVFSEVSAIENSISTQVSEAVESPDLYWAGAEVRGQYVVLTGAAPDVPAREAAARRALAVAGVSGLDNNIVVIGEAGDCQAQLNDYAQEQPIRFRSGQAVIADSSMQALAMYAMMVRKCGFAIEVAGHTDAQGDSEINKRLSQRRADEVAKHLVRHGVAPEKIRAMGYGESQPVAGNDTDKGRKLNRRIEFRVIGDTA